MGGEVPEVTHPKFRMWLPADGVVRLVWSPPVPSGLEDSIATVVSAVAILVGNPLSRMMGNFFMNVNKPKAPTRLFDDEAAAVAWLKGFLG